MTDKPEDALNEILAAARDAKALGEAAQAKQAGWPLARIGLVAGLGSAAIAAAVLYAGRRKDER